MGIALSALFLFLRDITENKLIGYLGFIAMVYFHYYCTRAYGGDPYFQYSPVRFLFPAVSIYLTYRYLNSSNNKLYYFCFILFAIGPFWNFDHGIVVFLSWMFVLIYRELLKREFKRIWKHIFLGLIAFSAVFIAFFLYVLLRYQQLPNWSSLLFYPRLYYTYGFSMMPMPPVHLWHMIILLYLVGLLLSIIYLRRRIATPKIEMVFYLSIIGVGIFYYYQGRSHDLTLVAVNYPAIILLTIYADSMLSRIRMRNRFSDILFVTGILCFMLYAAASLIGRGEDIYRIIHSRWVPLIKKESNSITEVADFVKNNTYKGEEVLIFSNLSAVLYFESGTTCPLALPNANDIYLVAQYEEIRKYLEDDSPSKVIAYMDDRVYKHIAKYLKDHKLVNQSNTGGLVVYVKE